jgi:hypothetical protein
VETFDLRRDAWAEREASHGHREEAVMVAYEQAGDQDSEAEERTLALRPALADEKELMRRGTFQQSTERTLRSMHKHDYASSVVEHHATIFSAVVPRPLINSAISVTGMGTLLRCLGPDPRAGGSPPWIAGRAL